VGRSQSAEDLPDSQMIDRRERNRLLVDCVLLPIILLTVALLGGLRIDGQTSAFLFLSPPLVTLMLSLLLVVLFVRMGAIPLDRWFDSRRSAITNISHALTLLTLFFASAQAFNSVLPEGGLLFWMFAFFFLWTLWNNQFSSFDRSRLIRSIAVLFGTAFILKHLLLASLYSPGGSWLKSLAGTLLQGVSAGILDVPVYAPATGYISFFTLALYVLGLFLVAPDPVWPTEPSSSSELIATTESVALIESSEDLDSEETIVVSRRSLD
jgi:hypothetical protein